MLRLVCPLALLVVGACQCGSEDLTVLSPHVVGPSSIELGVLYAGFSRSAWIAVDNTGEAPAALRATTVTQTAGPPVELGVSPSLGELAAGERLLLEVHALASDGSVGPFTAEVQLAFDDEELRVAVLGEVRSIPECADDPCAEVVFDGTRCVATPLEDGTSCEDHDACTVRTVCAAGRCVGQLRTCPDDGIACTVETCSPDLGCSSVPVDDRCDDGNACTDDTCGSGGCVHLAEPDGTPCSEDVCALALCQDQACVELDIPLEELCAPGEECLVDPSCFEPAGPWASVAGGERHTCAITDDHALYCWGTNEYAERWFSPVPVQEPTLATDWRQVAAGSDVTCAIKLDGRLFCWGDNHMM